MSAFNAYAPALWEHARDDYLAGDTAAVVCGRYGLSRSQFYAQARMGGWRKGDQPGSGPQPFAGAAPALGEDEPLDPDAPVAGPAALAQQALARGGRAVMRGRLAEAQGWVRLAARLRALAVQDADGAWMRAVQRESGGEDAGEALVAPPAPAPVEAPADASDTAPVEEALSVIREVERIAQESAALAAAPPGPNRDAAARALEARTAALEAHTAAWNAQAPAGESGGAEPPPASDAAAAPDSPDVISAPVERPAPPVFAKPREGPEWAADCRARAAERPEEPAWVRWAEKAERGERW